MRVYLSGPVTGMAGGNRDEFGKAARGLRGAGHRVFSPVEDIWPEATHEEAMLECLHRLTSLERAYLPAADDIEVRPLFDALVRLPGWEGSAGARLEVQVAEACGIAVADWDGEGVRWA